jgi:ubiquinone/menaquinone biosynthesis C-methylase UbiE
MLHRVEITDADETQVLRTVLRLVVNGPLPMNLQTGALVLRDLQIPRFKGSRQEDFRGILTPALSPGGGEEEAEAVADRISSKSYWLWSWVAIAIVALGVLLPSPCFAQINKETGGRYVFRQEHSRDGIGKFYMGREIAHVMGHQAADWLERPEREEEEKTDLMIKSLPVRPGDVVADIGAGSGYFEPRLSKMVGPKGSVLAVDIQPEMLELLTNKMAAAKITNVKGILGTIDDPKLPSNTVDLVLMVDVYHEFSHPFEMIENICKSLRPGGRVAFVEFRGEDPNVPIKPLHKMTEAQVRKEMAVHPLEWVETISVLPRQHIIVFKRK